VNLYLQDQYLDALYR